MSEQPEGHRLLDDNDALMFEAATAALDDQHGRVQDLVSDPGASFWENEIIALQPFFVPAILDVMISGADFSMGSLVQGVKLDASELDMGAVFDDLEFAAQQNGITLATQINETTRNKLAAIYALVLAGELGSAEAEAAVGEIFGPTRASLIAVNESTAAFVQGVEALANSVAAQGILTDEYWLTVNDNLVCQICQPLHGTQRNVAWTVPPPQGSHLGCRCGTVLVLAGEEITDPLFEFVGEV